MTLACVMVKNPITTTTTSTVWGHCLSQLRPGQFLPRYFSTTATNANTRRGNLTDTVFVLLLE